MIDHILINGKFHTLDSQQPHATALAIIGERVVALGSDDHINRLAGPDFGQIGFLEIGLDP